MSVFCCHEITTDIIRPWSRVQRTASLQPAGC